LNADNDSETIANIRSATEERVAARNLINAARMARGNAIPADRIFARGAIVSLLIRKAIRLAGELRRICARVVQHTRAGYQLNTRHGLISGRHQHNQLNSGDSSLLPEIPTLTPTEAAHAPKLSFAKVVELQNNRGPINSMQRAGKARAERRTRQQVEEENRALARVAIARTQAGSPGTGDEIEAEQPLARRRRMGSSSPSAGPAARNTTRKGGRGSSKGRGEMSTRGRARGRRQ
jgi:hypothetical protein